MTRTEYGIREQKSFPLVEPDQLSKNLLLKVYSAVSITAEHNHMGLTD